MVSAVRVGNYAYCLGLRSFQSFEVGRLGLVSRYKPPYYSIPILRAWYWFNFLYGRFRVVKSCF